MYFSLNKMDYRNTHTFTFSPYLHLYSLLKISTHVEVIRVSNLAPFSLRQSEQKSFAGLNLKGTVTERLIVKDEAGLKNRWNWCKLCNDDCFWHISKHKHCVFWARDKSLKPLRATALCEMWYKLHAQIIQNPGCLVTIVPVSKRCYFEGHSGPAAALWRDWGTLGSWPLLFE